LVNAAVAAFPIMDVDNITVVNKHSPAARTGFIPAGYPAVGQNVNCPGST
jgi:hypothetical protein